MGSLPAFAGTTAPSDLLTKLDAQAVELEARRTSTTARLGALEARNAPAGVAIGSNPYAFIYSALAAAGWTAATSKGLSSTATRPDSDGKFAVGVASATRFAMLSYESSTNGSPYTATFRVTIYDVNAAGAVTQTATQTIAIQGSAPYQLDSCAILGLVDVSGGAGTIWKGEIQSWTTTNSFTWFQNTACLTATLDTGTLALSIAVDRNDSQGQAETGRVIVPQNGTWSRRRSYTIGAAGTLTPRSRYAYPFGNNNAAAWEASYMLRDRVPGSGTFVAGSLMPETNAVGSFVLDRLTDRHFVTLADGPMLGASPVFAGRVALFTADDGGRGPVAGACRLGNALSGNARLVALSATLVVAGYTTGSQYGTYAVARNAGDNALRQVGAMSVAGTLGVVPYELLAYGAAKVASLVKGSGWLAQLTTYSVDPAATDGASPFAQVAQSASFPLGAGLASAAVGDNVAIGAVERLSADRVVVVSRNVTRALTAVEVFDLT